MGLSKNTIDNEKEKDDNAIIDFSSGKPEIVEDTATKVKEVSVETIKPGGAFSVFRDLIEKVDISEEVKEAGNVTIFSPFNDAFDKLPTKLEDMDLPTLRKIVLKHFVKGFLRRRDIQTGPVSTNCFEKKMHLANRPGTLRDLRDIRNSLRIQK